MSEIEFSNEMIKQIKDLVNSEPFSVVRREAFAREWRNETTADWISNFMSRMKSKDDALVNAKTGQPHTVESMVEELRERVKLDNIQKTAGISDLPLSAKMVVEARKKKDLSDTTLQSINQFINDLYGSHRGHIDDPAVIYACREKFGDQIVADYGSEIEDIIKEAREAHKSMNVHDMLPSPFQGQPWKADHQYDLNQPLFENIKNI